MAWSFGLVNSDRWECYDGAFGAGPLSLTFPTEFPGTGEATVGQYVVIDRIKVTIACSAALGNRRALVDIQDNDFGVRSYEWRSAATAVANQTHVFNFAPAVSYGDLGLYAQEPIPLPLVLSAEDSSLILDIGGAQAGDLIGQAFVCGRFVGAK